MHKTLEQSESILKLESVFEWEGSIYMVYEYGEMQKLSSLTLEGQGKDDKALVFSILAGLSELNSVGFCIGQLDSLRIVRTRIGNMNDF